MAVDSVRHGFLCNNSGLSISMHGVQQCNMINNECIDAKFILSVDLTVVESYNGFGVYLSALS